MSFVLSECPLDKLRKEKYISQTECGVRNGKGEPLVFSPLLRNCSHFGSFFKPSISLLKGLL